jgi:hypothetical protein
MAKTTNSGVSESLGRGLAAVAVHLEPRDAGETTATLSEAMGHTTDFRVLRFRAQGLAAVAARTEPKESADISCEAAASLTYAMSKTTEREALQQLAEGLAVVLRRDGSVRRAQQGRGVDGAGGGQVGSGSLPPPLPGQTLVELLKQPLCVGEARRLVLEQLARRYQRPFADQWDFVRFAGEHQLGLDLVTRPQRLRTATAGAPQPPSQPLIQSR